MSVLELGLGRGQLLHGTPFSSFQQFQLSPTRNGGFFTPSLAEAPHAGVSGVHSSAAALLLRLEDKSACPQRQHYPEKHSLLSGAGGNLHQGVPALHM